MGTDPSGHETLASQNAAQLGHATVALHVTKGVVASATEVFGGIAAIGMALSYAGGSRGIERSIFLEILDGVHRAKAAHYLGRITVKAHLKGTPPAIVFQAPVPLLLSPKPVIDIETPRGLFRWKRALEEANAGTGFPIEVEPGLKGTPISEVRLGSFDWGH